MAHVRPENGKLRFAVVGYSLGGSAFHAPFIATTPGLELAAIVGAVLGKDVRVVALTGLGWIAAAALFWIVFFRSAPAGAPGATTAADAGSAR